MDIRLSEENSRIAQMNTQATENNTAVEIATTKASEAATSATNAATSATSASTSAASASGSATTATTKASEAATSKTSASGSAATATEQAGIATTKATAASASELKAKKWADNNENIEVEEGKYSAKHWASKAAGIVLDGILDDTAQSLITTYSSEKIENSLIQKVNASDIQNSLTSEDINKPLAASQGKALKAYIDNINTLLTSSDASLDELQEIVNFIKINKVTLDTLGITNIAGLENALAAKLDASANAVSATKLATSKTINGVAFDGSANITVYDSTKAPLASPALTGTPTAPTATVGTNTTQLATTAFVLANAPSSTVIVRPTKVATNQILVNGVTLTLTSPVAGTDYYFSRTAITTTADADTIGGFHYGLVPTGEVATGNKTEADMVNCRGLWGSSIWTNWFKPKGASPKAMNYVPELGYWVDIYLMDGDYANYGYSRAGATIAGGVTADGNGRALPKIPALFGGNGTTNYGKLTPFVAWDIANAAKKKLFPYKDFTIAAYGVLEAVSSQTNAYEVVVGKIEHYPNLLSKYMEQATGLQWIWGADFGSSSATAWSEIADGRGKVYSNANAVLLGGHRGDGVSSGSRASLWLHTLSVSSWVIGCRLACDHFELV
jgi:hypothetical protein